MIFIHSKTIRGVIMTNNANIIYKDIPGYDGLYRVSNFGDVKSCSRDVFTGSGDKRRIIKLKEKRLNPSNRKGYKVVNLRKDNKTLTIGVHQLVLWAFVGVQQKGIEVRHLNSNPSDDRLENLRYGTKSENMQDAVELGTLVFSRSKLSRKDVEEIAKAKGSLKEIALAFNCHPGTVQAIKTRKSFKNFVKEINYTPRKKIELSSDALEKIRDKNIPRQEVAKIFNLSINQIKRIRKGNNTIYTC